MPPPEKPLPLPRPKPKPPKHKHKPEPERAQTHGTLACAYQGLCPPPPPPPSPTYRAATVHLRSSRLPTPLIALSASLLTVSVVLLVILLVCSLVRRRRRRRRRLQSASQEAPLTQRDEEVGLPVPAAVAAEEGEDDDGGIHHVWYIRTVGLDERAIAAITALVYDAKCGAGLGGSGDDDGSCAVCLAEFHDGETLRLLPRCGHAFHRGCIDTWLRAHVNCPLCRAPVHVAGGQPASANAAPGATTGEPASNIAVADGASTENSDRDGDMPERAIRRAVSMVALPRRAWPDVSLRAPASSSGREGEMGLVKITRVLKLSEALEMAGVGVGRSVSFGAASCLHLPNRSGPSATGINADEMSR